ncbi:hypothetical protein FRC09_002763 [Ceratobasidium sp. 395]|nr:hypothetical protein FRC09_002763 [Ceratobasidium sp. 395]
MRVIPAFAILLWSSTTSALSLPRTGSSRPTVKLPDARYQGFHNETTGLDVFLGIRYAKAPTGALRWRAPKAPKPSDRTLQATSQPAKCFQLNLLSGGNGTTPGVPGPSEDCLFLNVFSPPKPKKKLPVLVWVHGGGYFAGFAAEYDPTAMIRASNNSFIAVIIQYRLGMFGFLPGAEVKKNGDLNAGLLDVQFALKWTRENIHLWGGDPNRVTLWGESAGAGAVLMQVVANGGRTKPQLFKRAIASSTYVPPTYRYDDPQAEGQYSLFVNNTGSNDTLGCLRSADFNTLSGAATLLPRPVVDGKFITQRPELSLARKQVNGEKLISLHNVDEGFIFVKALSNPNSTLAAALQEQFPNLSEQNKTAVTAAYGIFTGSNASPQVNSFTTQVAVYGEAQFVCPSLWLVDAFPKKGYQGLFAIPPSFHSQDLGVYFPGDLEYRTSAVPPAQPYTESVTHSFMGALVSFIVTGSPNKNPLNKTINPNWNLYDPKKPRGMTFNITASGVADTKFEAVNSNLRDRCELWRSLAPYTPQ